MQTRQRYSHACMPQTKRVYIQSNLRTKDTLGTGVSLCPEVVGGSPYYEFISSLKCLNRDDCED